METITVDYVKRIPVEVFEFWYENQIIFQKVVNLPTITDLESNYIQIGDAAMLLGVTREKMSHITRRSNLTDIFEIVVFDDKKWISKKSFQLFLNAQNTYKVICPEAEEKLLTLRVIISKEYISKSDAARLAGVTDSAITKWAQAGKFTVTGAGRVMRINRQEFLDWIRDNQGKEY